MSRFRAAGNYIEVLKPRETLLLTFIGVCASIIAAGGNPAPGRLGLALIAIAVGSAGTNGLTNYLDRRVDALMERTRKRALPSRRIYPPEKVLPLTIGLTLLGLALAWMLNPIASAFGLLGVTAALVLRKTVACPFLGSVSGLSPVMVGWLVFQPTFGWDILILALFIVIWVPLHVWSVMVGNRQDYLGAGLRYFPLSLEPRQATRSLLLLSILLYPASVAFYFVSHLHWTYIVTANILGIAMILASVRSATSQSPRDAWRVYKLTAFPYLGLIFLAMIIGLWVK